MPSREPKLTVVILAAGHGKRMASRYSKVLYKLAGKSMIHWVIDAARSLSAAKIIVVHGSGENDIRQSVNDLDILWVEQKKRKGTGHAVQQAMPKIPDSHRVLVLYGDVPLVSAKLLKGFTAAIKNSQIGILMTDVDNPLGYGRIIHDDVGNIAAIVEEKDTNKEQKLITEINTGIMLAPAQKLKHFLPMLSNKNKNKEYYLTDIVKIAIEQGKAVGGMKAPVWQEVLGVNTREQLADLERYYQHCQAQALMNSGVSLIDPNRFDLRGTLKAGFDCVFDINTVFTGKNTIGHDCYIGPNCQLSDVKIGNNVQIEANSVIKNSVIGDDCLIGPFSHIQNESKLKKAVEIGNFVEINHSIIGDGTTIKQLSYIENVTLSGQIIVKAGTVIVEEADAKGLKSVIKK